MWSRKVKKKMPTRPQIQLPADVNPQGLLTIRRAAEISGIPLKTLYEWRRQPWRGLRVYKLGAKKIFVKADEFVRWINANLEPV